MYHPVPILVHSLGLRGTRMSESGLPAPSSDVTVLLWRLGEGDANVANELARLVYEELHRIADRAMRSERPDHTLQPTLLVNEAFVRLIGQREARWQSRAQFYAMAAQAIRRILVDHARAAAPQARFRTAGHPQLLDRGCSRPDAGPAVVHSCCASCRRNPEWI